jgi:hypothetical protein
MDHHDHDDGLVHSHGWATEPPPSIGMLLRPANDVAGARPDIAAAMNVKQDHDDGLVHGHAWASDDGRLRA